MSNAASKPNSDAALVLPAVGAGVKEASAWQRSTRRKTAASEKLVATTLSFATSCDPIGAGRRGSAGERRPKSRRPHNMSVARHLASDNKIADDEHGDHHGKFTLEELQVFKANRDFTHVDPAKLEIYLSVEDFAMYFKMDRVAFDALPNWKKSGLKKTIGIF